MDTDGDTVVDGAECLLGYDPNTSLSRPPSFRRTIATATACPTASIS